MLSTVALKYTAREKRPDNNDRDSFPSGHTASAISAATFVHKRYGIEYAFPLYMGQSIRVTVVSMLIGIILEMC